MVKKVAAINDLSGFGKCSLTAAIPILSVLGVQACPLPTALLTAQTGFESYFIEDCTDKIDFYISEWNKMGVNFDGIYTGFLASEKQSDKILEFIASFKKQNTVLVVDPVMGDNGKIYSTYTPGLCEKIKSLVSKAHITTPNLTEACILADESYESFMYKRHDPDYMEYIKELGQKLISMYGTNTVIITGVHFNDKISGLEYIYNVGTDKSGNAFFSRSKACGCGYSGTGDIFASIICGYAVLGKSISEAADKAAFFIECALRDAYNEKTDRNFGINFEKYMSVLV